MLRKVSGHGNLREPRSGRGFFRREVWGARGRGGGTTTPQVMIIFMAASTDMSSSHHLAARHDDDEAGGGVGRGRRYRRTRAAHRCCSLISARPRRSRKPMLQAPVRGYSIITTLRNELRLRQHALGEALHATVDGAHQRNAVEQILPQTHQRAADEIGDQQPGQQHARDANSDPEARQLQPEQRFGRAGAAAAAAACDPSARR